MSEDVFFRMSGINKYYQMGDERMQVLKNVCLEMKEGEYLPVRGLSR